MRKPTLIIICITLILAAIAANIIIVKTAPKAEKKRPPRMAPLVETQPLKAAHKTVVLELTGTVVPAEEIQLRARINGEIVAISPDFIDGGLLKKGSEILKIDPIDYELALADAESKLENARYSYTLELGRQDVAKHEWELLKTDNPTELEKELALRKPHLAADKASLKAAEAGLKKARLDLARTQIFAPFDALVLERKINIGSQAAQQDILAQLAGTDTYWVQVSIPVDRLSWVNVPGSTAKIISSSGAVRQGEVIKLLGDLEEKGRMARLLVEIKDPLCLTPKNKKGNPLLLGEYVRVEVDGRELKDVCDIPRRALRENNLIWVVTAESKLDIRPVEVLWRNSKQVLIQNGISEKELLIISDLTAPIKGMDVNTGNGKSKDTPKKKKKPANKE